jgi:GTP-binding protein Era
MKEKSASLTTIEATLHVEKASQKGIVVGKGGRMIKSIGTAARKELEEFLGKKVFLELYVKVSEKWRKKGNQLKDFGYSD